jgi:hypothetical protein
LTLKDHDDNNECQTDLARPIQCPLGSRRSSDWIKAEKDENSLENSLELDRGKLVCRAEQKNESLQMVPVAVLSVVFFSA